MDIFSGDNVFKRAKVVDNVDSDQHGQVMLWIPDLMPLIKDDEGIWGKPANNPLGGRNDENESDNHFMGSSYVPAKGSWVWVFFENNNINRPFYFGSLDLKNTKILPECQVGNNPEKKWVILKTHDGRTIVISDDSDDARIEFTGKKRKLKNPPSGDTDSVYTIDENQTTILFDERENKEKVLIRTHKGDFFHVDINEQKLQAYFKEGIELKSDGDINITGKNINLKAGENLNQEASDSINIKSDLDSVNIEANDILNFKSGSSLNIETITDINLKAAGKISEQSAAALSLMSSASISADAPIVSDNGGISQPAQGAGSAQDAEEADPQGGRDD